MRKLARNRLKGKIEKFKFIEAVWSQFRNISLEVQEVCGTHLSRQGEKQCVLMVKYVNIYVDIFQKLDQTGLAESMNGNYSQHQG